MEGGSGPRFIAPKDDSIYNGKRMRKSVVRRGVDYNASYLNLIKKRKFRRDLRDDEFLQWDLDEPTGPVEEKAISHPEGAKYLLPPSAIEQNFASSICTRFTHTSINKVRFPVTALAMASDGKRVITGASSGEFTLWNAQHFNFETILQAHDTAIRSMVFSHSDEFLLSGDHGGMVKYWHPNFNCVKVFQAHDQPLRQVCFSPTDLKFTTCSDDGLVKVWDFVRAEQDCVLEGHGWDVRTVDWHSSKAIIASGGKDNKVKLWDPRGRKELCTLHAHKQTVLAVKWNMNGNWLLTASRDQLVKLFDIRVMKEIQMFRGHKRDVTCCQWHPFHEGLFVTGSGDGSVNFHQVGLELPIGKIDGAHESSIWDVAWHPFGHEVATISNDQLLRFWTRNRPGDRLDDKYNLTTRQEANVDLGKVSRFSMVKAEDGGMIDHQTAVVSTPILLDSVSTVIPGMSSVQAKQRRMRTHAIPASKPGVIPNREIVVVSYDMLAQVNATNKNFPDASETLLGWQYRSQNLLLELKQRNADVLCLQEVSFYREFWQQNLKGYQSAFQAHPDQTSGKGVAIMTRPQKLALKHALQVRFSDDDQAFRSVAVVGVYEVSVAAPAASGPSVVPKVMYVICSVNLSNYGNDAKQYEQAMVLLQTIERAKASCKPDLGRPLIVNVILSGNFNMVPDSPVYSLITKVDPTQQPAHSLGLSSAYGHFQAGREPAYTTISKAWEGTTDYVFYSHENVGIKELLDFPSKDLVGGSLPTADYSSNHFCLGVNFLSP